MAYCREVSDKCEENPDLFMRRTYLPMLTAVRQRLADFTKANLDETVLVPNATHGVQTVVSNIIWQKDDVIIACSSPPLPLPLSLAFA